ncbi:hypothetical protein [Photobacterium leiognathi]|uniref:hypothetical protein n=1 Tax=Photobacterium leiognathi TaxID=553611 RepID=UPI002981C9A0|nr:hypothetical protein [Photobacterium leiognathi]
MLDTLRQHSQNANRLYSLLTQLEQVSVTAMNNMEKLWLISEIKLLISKYSFDYKLMFGDNLTERFQDAIMAFIK